MTYEKFSQQVVAIGLTPRDCGEGHWQIRGGKYLVNFYPQKPSFFVCGMNSGCHCRIVQRALRKAIIATQLPPSYMKRSTRWGTSRSGKRKQKSLKHILFKRDPKCYWCTKLLTLPEATLDHMIPLSRGGSNSPDNQVLACYSCNQTRGNNLPKRTKWQHV